MSLEPGSPLTHHYFHLVPLAKASYMSKLKIKGWGYRKRLKVKGNYSIYYTHYMDEDIDGKRDERTCLISKSC